MTNVSSNSQIVTLRRWRVTEVVAPEGRRSRHVWGHDVTHDEGRASSPIIKFDLETMTATTHSGTNYRLLGLPGNSRQGRHVWGKWCRRYGVVSELDVTNEYLNIDELPADVLAKINGLCAATGQPLDIEAE